MVNESSDASSLAFSRVARVDFPTPDGRQRKLVDVLGAKSTSDYADVRGLDDTGQFLELWPGREQIVFVHPQHEKHIAPAQCPGPRPGGRQGGDLGGLGPGAASRQVLVQLQALNIVDVIGVICSQRSSDSCCMS